MVRLTVLAIAVCAAGAASAQSLEQYGNSQRLQSSQQELRSQSVQGDIGRSQTSATIGSRIEGQQVRRQIQVDRSLNRPGLGSQPLR